MVEGWVQQGCGPNCQLGGFLALSLLQELIQINLDECLYAILRLWDSVRGIQVRLCQIQALMGLPLEVTESTGLGKAE